MRNNGSHPRVCIYVQPTPPPGRWRPSSYTPRTRARSQPPSSPWSHTASRYSGHMQQESCSGAVRRHERRDGRWGGRGPSGWRRRRAGCCGYVLVSYVHSRYANAMYLLGCLAALYPLVYVCANRRHADIYMRAFPNRMRTRRRGPSRGSWRLCWWKRGGRRRMRLRAGGRDEAEPVDCGVAELKL